MPLDVAHGGGETQRQDPAASLLALGGDASAAAASTNSHDSGGKRSGVDDDGAVATAAAAAAAAAIDAAVEGMPPIGAPAVSTAAAAAAVAAGDAHSHSHPLSAAHQHQHPLSHQHLHAQGHGIQSVGVPRGAASRDDKWQEMFEMLTEYKAERGDCLVPGRHGKLGPWTQIQRAQHRLLKEGKPSNLTDDRVQRLESIGFTWQVNKDREECWRDMYAELLRFRDAHGHINVSSTSREHARLGSWCKRQRMTYRLIREGKPSPMKPEWGEKLNEIGFDFDGSKRSSPARDDDALFILRLGEVRAFVEANGHCLIPDTFPQNEALGKWVAQKRKQKRRLDEGKTSKLTSERVRQLDELGFVWQIWGNRVQKWEEMFQEIKAHREQTGTCRVALRDAKHRKLGMWVDRQKTNYRLRAHGQPSPLSDERIQKLEDIGFEWQISNREYEADSWSKRLAELQEYRKRFGDCLVPRNWEENNKLGRWVDHQRQQYRNRQKGARHYMPDEKLKKLQDAGFAFTPPPHILDQWTQSYNDLVEYKRQHGDCRVPYSYPANPGLGTWVDTLRTQYWRLKRGRTSRLTVERIKMLDDLGMEWDSPVNEDVTGGKVATRGSWETRFEELVAYKQQTGDCNVPNSYAPNKKLGSFVKKQREDYRLYNSGKQTPMNPERIKRLESINFMWTVVAREYSADSWAQRFAELKGFKAAHGHCFVPRLYPANQKLAYWVERQRQDYRNRQKGKHSKMTDERKAILEEVGFHWSAADKKKLKSDEDKVDAVAAQDATVAAIAAVEEAVGGSSADQMNLAIGDYEV
jgi:hypothetical protein